MAYEGLTKLDASERDLSSDEIKGLFLSTSLRKLKLDNAEGLCSNDLKYLEFNTTLLRLDLTSVGLDPSAGEILTRNTTITDLCLFGNDLGDEAIVALMRNNTTLTSLDIGRNRVFDKGLVAIAACSSLKTLAVAGTDTSCGHDDEEEPISKAATIALAGNTTITRMYLGGYVDFVKDFLPKNTTVTDLRLLDIKLVPCVADALVKNTSITKLWLSNVGGKEARILAEHQSLAHISVIALEIEDLTAMLLSTNASLVSLSVGLLKIRSLSAACELSTCRALLQANCAQDGNDMIMECVERNRRRVRESSCAFAMAFEMVFKLKAGMRKRMRSQ